WTRSRQIARPPRGKIGLQAEQPHQRGGGDQRRWDACLLVSPPADSLNQKPARVGKPPDSVRTRDARTAGPKAVMAASVGGTRTAVEVAESRSRVTALSEASSVRRRCTVESGCESSRRTSRLPMKPLAPVTK